MDSKLRIAFDESQLMNAKTGLHKPRYYRTDKLNSSTEEIRIVESLSKRLTSVE